ncbi:YbdD/YjiX family protein [Nocardioides dilutus]
MRDAVLRAGRGLRWYVRQATGEAKWDEYVAACRADGTEPVSRREFERHRAEHREANPQARCC